MSIVVKLITGLFTLLKSASLSTIVSLGVGLYMYITMTQQHQQQIQVLENQIQLIQKINALDQAFAQKNRLDQARLALDFERLQELQDFDFMKLSQIQNELSQEEISDAQYGIYTEHLESLIQLNPTWR